MSKPKPQKITPRYPSDLTDKQWQLLEPLFCASSQEPARVYPVRGIVNAIFYVNRTGCQWDFLPSDLPPWKVAYNQFHRWRQNGTWDRVHDTLRDNTRTLASRNPQPTAAIIDAKATLTTEKGGYVAMMLVRRSKVGNDTSS